MLVTEKLKRFIDGEEGVTTVEYALLITLIVLAITQSIFLMGSQSKVIFTLTADALP